MRSLADEAAVQRAWRDGQALSQADAIAYALGAGPDATMRSGNRLAS